MWVTRRCTFALRAEGCPNSVHTFFLSVSVLSPQAFWLFLTSVCPSKNYATLWADEGDPLG
jgi:hypothetical protein